VPKNDKILLWEASHNRTNSEAIVKIAPGERSGADFSREALLEGGDWAIGRLAYRPIGLLAISPQPSLAEAPGQESISGHQAPR